MTTLVGTVGVASAVAECQALDGGSLVAAVFAVVVGHGFVCWWFWCGVEGKVRQLFDFQIPAVRESAACGIKIEL